MLLKLISNLLKPPRNVIVVVLCEYNRHAKVAQFIIVTKMSGLIKLIKLA